MAARSSRPAIRTQADFQPFERSYRSLRALAIADASFPTYFHFKDGLAAGLVLNHFDIVELKTQRLIGSKSSIDCELQLVVQLFAFPFESHLLRLMRAPARRLIEL